MRVHLVSTWADRTGLQDFRVAGGDILCFVYEALGADLGAARCSTCGARLSVGCRLGFVWVCAVARG